MRPERTNGLGRKILRASALLVVGTGLILGVLGFMGVNPLMGQMGEEISAKDAGGDLVPSIEKRDTTATSPDAPKDKTLTMTIPQMKRIEDDAIPNATGEDEGKLKNYAGIHLEGTGFPWEEGANTYIAGHRLGYPGTDSFLAFWDQNELEEGDEIFVTDAEGREYTYRVFKEFVVDPEDVWVTKPVPGKSVLTLQTCTLPDYSRRLITRAELVEGPETAS